jgi:hypothetical protein
VHEASISVNNAAAVGALTSRARRHILLVGSEQAAAVQIPSVRRAVSAAADDSKCHRTHAYCLPERGAADSVTACAHSMRSGVEPPNCEECRKALPGAKRHPWPLESGDSGPANVAVAQRHALDAEGSGDVSTFAQPALSGFAQRSACVSNTRGCNRLLNKIGRRGQRMKRHVLTHPP